MQNYVGRRVTTISSGIQSDRKPLPLIAYITRCLGARGQPSGKKYKKTFTITHLSAIALGAVTAALSSAGIATAVTGIGAFASVPIGGVAAITGISSSLFNRAQ